MFLIKQDYQRKAGRVLLVSLSLILICMLTMGAVFDSARKDVTLLQVSAFAGTEDVSTISTRKATVGEFLKENNIIVGRYDAVNMDNDDLLFENTQIVIREGRVFAYAADGKIELAATTENTVEKALNEAGVFLREQDVVEPARDAKIDQNTKITVQRIDVTEEKVEEAIPFETIEKQDKTFYVGMNKILTEGAEGTKEIVYKVVRQDGVEISRTVVSETVTKEPINAVKRVGTKPVPVAAETKPETVTVNTNKDFSYKRKIEVTATAYDPSPAENGGYSRTAYGLKPQFGVVAVDPKVIPLGTKLYIESSDGGKSWVYGYCIAGDTGGAIKGNRVDLCFNTQRECINFGRRSATVYILD